MKKAFTLIEMLIVVVVIVTLMTMVFRLGSINGPSSKRNATVAKLQKLENCLSGYYAAYGMYPPVRLHASRNPFLTVSVHDIQNRDGEENRNIFGWDVEKFLAGKHDENEYKAWMQVKAACKAQPVDCRFPFGDDCAEWVQAHADILAKSAEDSTSISEEKRKMFMQGFDNAGNNLGRFTPYQDEDDWREVQLFKFGLMSFLLPRYLVMMNADKSFFRDHQQWLANNTLPKDPIDGKAFNNGWDSIWDYVGSTQPSQLAHVRNIPSQAACARWMPNLAGAVYTPHSLKLYGVDLQDREDGGFSLDGTEVYSPGGFDDDSTGQQYVLDFCTVRDGWWHEFYYYSPAPHQTYIVWSGGANDRTFPPWISREGLDAQANKCVGAWVEDDIVSMSH